MSENYFSTSHTKEIKNTVISTLIDFGCCPKCVLRFIGVSSYDAYSAASSDIKHLQDPDCINEYCNDEEFTAKRRKTSLRCTACLGITTELCDPSSVFKVVDTVKSYGYDADSFLFSLTIPTCLPIRQHFVLSNLKEKFPEVYKDKNIDDIPSVKEVWKWSFGPLFEKELHLHFMINSPFVINISVAYDDDQAECGWIRELLPHDKPSKKKGHSLSRSNVEKILANSNPLSIRRCLPCSLPEPKSPCRYEHISCFHAPIYFAGRYNKYSRHLSQTPWTIDGEKIMEFSVQEFIVAQIISKLKVDDIIFSASGREDVDVRTLGKGRPFLLQLINPRQTKLLPEDLKHFQDAVNGSTTQISIRDFQIVPKEDTLRLKEGEEEKIKTYSALCISTEPLNALQLAKLAEFKDLKLFQRTPIRVLHRRPVAVREKIIHAMSAELIDQHHFRLFLKTQAGTYVKEFVHSDFGRTNPSLRSLLNAEVDILELDVENLCRTLVDRPRLATHTLKMTVRVAAATSK